VVFSSKSSTVELSRKQLSLHRFGTDHPSFWLHGSAMDGGGEKWTRFWKLDRHDKTVLGVVDPVLAVLAVLVVVLDVEAVVLLKLDLRSFHNSSGPSAEPLPFSKRRDSLARMSVTSVARTTRIVGLLRKHDHHIACALSYRANQYAGDR
jgi:hypothetical protein